MGLFRVQIAVAPMEGGGSVALTAAGILPRRTQSFIVADGRRLEREIGYALVRAAGAETPDLVVFAAPGDLAGRGIRKAVPATPSGSGL